MKICLILGTRPEIIKFSPIIRECERLGLDYFILHTGQHYSYNMDKVFFQQLELPEPMYNLDIGSGTHAEQPDIVLVEGDTNSTLGALAAVKLNVMVGWEQTFSLEPTTPDSQESTVDVEKGELLGKPFWRWKRWQENRRNRSNKWKTLGVRKITDTHRRNQ